MSYSPTIIAASLDDKELQESINKMVANFDKGLQDMLDHTNTKVNAINEALKKIGVTNVSTKGSDDGGAAKRTSKLKEEETQIKANTQAVKENTHAHKKRDLTLDEGAKAMSRAIGMTPAQESYQAFVKNMRENVALLAMEIKSMPDWSLNRQFDAYMQYEKRIEQVRQRIQELKQELQNVASSPNSSRLVVKQITEQIAQEQQRMAQLQREQLTTTKQIELADKQALAQKQAQYETERKSLIEMSAGKREVVALSEKQAAQEAKSTDEIRRQAQAIRESKQWREKGVATVGNSVVYNTETNTSFTNKQKQALGSLEEQLLRIQQQQAAEQQRIAASTQETANAEQKVVSEAERRLQIEGSMQETLRKSREIMREMEAQKGGSVATFTPQLESLNKLSTRLKDLRKQYNEMTFGERFGAEGQKIAQNIRIVTRETQKLQAQLARPSSLKEALGLPAKNLDDISYKIRQLQSYMRGLDQTNIKSATEIRTVSAAIEELRKRENDLLGKQTQLFGSNNALANSWRYMRNRLAFYLTVGAGTSFIKQMVDVRSQYEMNERALGILINSAERGTKIFNELSQMALVSPYTLIELSAAAKQLTAYDIAAKDVVDTTRRLADMAAAVGVPIERLTYALGQIKAYGYLNSRDARMFANAGIPLVKQLADYYTELEGRLVSTADVYDRIKKKQVSFEDSVHVIKKMTDDGGKFFDFQAKMAETLKVQLANLNLAWNNMLNDMGEETQGTLVAGIGTLKHLFLHWKDVEHILYEVVIAFGAYKAAQMVSVALTGTFTKTLNANILAQKRSIASSLQKKALTQTLTAEEKRLVATQNLVTASDYRMALSSKGLTKQQALFLVATNRRNIALMRALIQMNMLTAAEVRNMTTGKALAIVWNLITLRIKSAATAIKSFASSNWVFLVLGSIYEIYHAWDNYSEHVAEVNRSAAEHAKEALKSIRDYLNNDLTQQTIKKAASGSLSNEEGVKAWNAMREKIEEASSASSTYLTQLFKTEDVSKRITLGAQYLQDIEKARSVMSEIEEDAITLSQTSWGGLLGEGIKDDLKDYESAIDDFAKVDSDVTQQSSKRWHDYWKERKEQQEEFANEVKKTTDDIYDVASKGGLSVNAQRELFEQALSERAQKEQLSVRGTRLLRIQAEKEYYNYAKTMLEERMQYEEGAQKQRTQNEIAALEAQFNSNKALQESFFAWLSDRHNNEVSKRLGHLTTEEIKTGKWLKGENLKWVKERAQDFTREYGLSFDTLYGYVKKANTWEIHIKTFFDTIGQPLTDVQKDYETRTGKKFKDNPLLKDATSQLDIVKKLQDEESRLTEEYEASEKAGGAYFVANKVRMESELNSLREQIHQYNALTKAEEKEQNARNKKVGGSSKKDLLGEAVQKNVQYINEIRKAYEDFKKDGLNATDAVEAATKHFGKSLARNNKELAKYGIQGLTGEQFATMNLQQVRDYFQNMINGAQGSAKAVEILEKEVKNIDEELTKFNQKAIADSLNNELSKLKDEYELAVALDADPEMGNLFAEMFGINTETLPKTIKEYADKMTEYLNKYLEGNKSDFRFGAGELFNLTQGDIDAFQSQVSAGTFNQAWFDVIKKAYDDINGKRQKELQDIFNKTKELEYKLADVNGKIAIEQKKLSDLQIKWQKETNEQKKHYLELQIQDQKNAIEQLEMESVKLMPFYEDLFGDLYNLSTRRLKEIIANAKQVMKPQNFVTDPSGQGYVQRTIAGKNGKNKVVYDIFSKDAEGKIKKATVSLDEYRKINKQIASVEKEVAEKNPWAKIKDSFSKDESGKIKNVAGGIEAIGGEISKMGQLTGVIGEIFASFSNPDEYNETAEVLGDISATMDGLGQAAQGVAQIYSGDIIGGATNVIKGLWTSISTWFDNTDKLIQQEIKDSEKAVKRLENSYKDLEFAVEHAYGMAEYGAKRAVIANKQLQLVEMQRQLRLEQSRESKYRDNDKILELKGSIIDLRNEIKQSIDDITNDLLGITSVGDAAEQLVSSMIDAFRQGEDYMTHFDESFEDMIDNMIMKAIVSRVIGDRLDEVWEQVKQTAEVRGEAEKKRVDALTKQLSDAQDKQMTAQAKYDNTVQEGLGQSVFEQIQGINTQKDLADANAEVKRVQALLKQAEKDYAEAIALKPEDVQGIRDILPSWRDDTENMFNSFMEAFGIKKGDRVEDKNLSNLQQGLQSVTEDTANAVEAYLNGMSQQAYLRNDLLTQIRDTVQGFDLDAQLGVQSQMLLQLQQSFAVHQSIQSILESVLTPNGKSFSVELAS